jgi:cysteine desulfuration protein SufE
MDKNFYTTTNTLKQMFTSLTTPDERYSYIIDLGRQLPKLPLEFQLAENIIPGCQSILYFNSTFNEGKLFFSAHCDALISAGLAALLISVYSGLEPKTILLNPPIFLHELGIFASLSPSRSNGLVNIYTRLKSDAIKNLPQ